MSQPFLSLATITGNVGEALITRFLEQFAPLADEIVIVRAIGNQDPDETLDVARDWCSKHGKPLITGAYFNECERADWPHVDDFAAARNLAWGIATGQWLMWADTDDLISPDAHRALRTMLEQHGDKFDLIITPYRVPDAGSRDNPRERVVRAGISHWIQPVHECLAPIDPAGKWRTVRCDAAYIVHDPGVKTQQRGRGGRNLRILQSLREDQITPSLRYHLFAEQMAVGNYAAGALAAEEYLKFPEGGRTERFHCAFSIGALVVEDPNDKAAWFQLAAQECPWRREPLVLLANLALQSGDLAAAEAWLLQAGALPLPEHIPWNIMRKFWGWKYVQELARLRRAQNRFAHAAALELNHFIRHGGKISLLHATRGRPQQALEIRERWLDRAENADAVEHIFALDADDDAGIALACYRHVIQETPGGPVGAWNLAAAASSGQILVQVSDDMIPPQGWDRSILERLTTPYLSTSLGPPRPLGESIKIVPVLEIPKVLRVSDGHRTDGLIVLAIVTRAWVQQQGYLFHPAFFSMFSDNWLTESAQRAGAIIEAPDLVFEHQHPAFTGEPMHPTTAASNRLLHYATGAKILEQLRAGQEPFTWENVPGLTSDGSPALVHERIIASLPEKPVCVEVGVAQGRGLACMATLAEFKGGHAVGIDHFAGTPGEAIDYPPDMERICRENIRRCGLREDIVAKSSLATAADGGWADYIFLDAAHDYESVCADLAAWWPKIRPGGWLAGHDYLYAEGVRRAVDETFPTAEKLGECWLIQKPTV